MQRRWSSQIGFILASVGAAVGLGNIQRFPYLAANYGGGAFVFIYIIAVIVMALPLMLVEFALGRSTRKNAKDAIVAIVGKKTWWSTIGYLNILTAFFILSYYLVISGWTVSYAWHSLIDYHINLSSHSASAYSVIMTVTMLAVTFLIVFLGINNGIENLCKWLMPIMLIILLLLAALSLSLPKAKVAMSFYLIPDFSKITTETIVMALSQAFFSLCIGEAVLINYARYVHNNENLVTAALFTAGFDTVVAVLAGLVTLPILFTYTTVTDVHGLGLIFDVLPKQFANMLLGNVVGAMFFIVLSIAALTTCVALAEVVVSFVQQHFAISRLHSIVMTMLAALAVSFIIAISLGYSKTMTSFMSVADHDILFLLDYFWGGIAMLVGGLGLSIFTLKIWTVKRASLELLQGSQGFFTWISWWRCSLYLSVVFILLIFFASYSGF